VDPERGQIIVDDVEEQRPHAAAALGCEHRERLELGDALAGRPRVVGALVDVDEGIPDRNAVAAGDEHEGVGRGEQALVQGTPARPRLGAVDRRQAGRPERPVVVEEREPQRLDLGQKLRPAALERDPERRRAPLAPAQPSSRVGSISP
jgi:hypothetical protein